MILFLRFAKGLASAASRSSRYYRLTLQITRCLKFLVEGLQQRTKTSKSDAALAAATALWVQLGFTLRPSRQLPECVRSSTSSISSNPPSLLVQARLKIATRRTRISAVGSGLLQLEYWTLSEFQ